MISLQTVLFWISALTHQGVRLRVRIIQFALLTLMFLIISGGITGLVFFLVKNNEEAGEVSANSTEPTIQYKIVASTKTETEPTWSPIESWWTPLPTVAFSTVQHQPKELSPSVITPVLANYTSHDPNQSKAGITSFRGNLLIDNISLDNFLVENFPVKPGWTSKGTITHYNQLRHKQFVWYSASGIFIDGVFPSTQTNLTNDQITDVRYQKPRFEGELLDSLIHVPIADIYPNDAFVFLVEYFQLNLDRHSTKLNFKVHLIYF